MLDSHETRQFPSRAAAGQCTRAIRIADPRVLSHVTSICTTIATPPLIFLEIKVTPWLPNKPNRLNCNNNNSSQSRKRRKQRRSKSTLQSGCLFPFHLCASLTSYRLFFSIHYSDRYSDDEYEYRHVILPKPLFKMIPKTYFNPDDPGVLRLLSEAEWRGIGITQSLGWEHYEVHGSPSCLPHHTPHR